MMQTKGLVVAAAVFIAIGIGAFACGYGKNSEEKNALPDSKKIAARDAAAAQPKQVADTLTIIARLIEIPGSMPPNDLYNYVYIMKYRVIKVEKGAYQGTEILIGVYNPLIPRKQIAGEMRKNAAGDVAKFTVGDKHRLTLVTPIDRVWKDQVEDDYFDSDLPKYYAVRTDIAR